MLLFASESVSLVWLVVFTSVAPALAHSIWSVQSTFITSCSNTAHTGAQQAQPAAVDPTASC